MEKAKRKYINAIRGNREFTADTMEFFNSLNKYLAEIEWESTEKDFAIQDLLNEISIYVDLMKSYGIDIGKVGARSIFSIHEQIQSEMLTIPENLIQHDTRKRHTRRQGLSLLPGSERRHITIPGRNERTGESREYALDDLR